jgi:hypothetical protein
MMRTAGRTAVLAVLAAGLLGLAPTSAPASVPARAAGPTLVVPAATAHLPATWRQLFVVGYGRSRDLLGTSRGGDSGTLRIGPEYGAAAPDGSWWFLDAAKQRLAHYSAAGHYRGQVPIPQRLLVGGRYFQWQLPHVLANGSLVAARQSATRTYLLRLRHGTVDEIAVAGPAFAPTYDDGKLVYGFAGDGTTVAVNPRTGASTRVTSFRTPSGSPFSLSAGRRLKVVLASGAESFPLTTASGARARVGMQVRAGADDTLHLFLYGAGADHPSRQLVGATSVAPSGAVPPIEALPNPFSEADPGSPSQLVMAPGSTVPMLIYVLPDGVHVFARV